MATMGERVFASRDKALGWRSAELSARVQFALLPCVPVESVKMETKPSKKSQAARLESKSGSTALNQIFIFIFSE
jgi:hypothetical protein